MCQIKRRIIFKIIRGAVWTGTNVPTFRGGSLEPYLRDRMSAERNGAKQNFCAKYLSRHIDLFFYRVDGGLRMHRNVRKSLPDIVVKLSLL